MISTDGVSKTYWQARPQSCRCRYSMVRVSVRTYSQIEKDFKRCDHQGERIRELYQPVGSSSLTETPGSRSTSATGRRRYQHRYSDVLDWSDDISFITSSGGGDASAEQGSVSHRSSMSGTSFSSQPRLSRSQHRPNSAPAAQRIPGMHASALQVALQSAVSMASARPASAAPVMRAPSSKLVDQYLARSIGELPSFFKPAASSSTSAPEFRPNSSGLSVTGAVHTGPACATTANWPSGNNNSNAYAPLGSSLHPGMQQRSQSSHPPLLADESTFLPDIVEDDEGEGGADASNLELSYDAMLLYYGHTKRRSPQRRPSPPPTAAAQPLNQRSSGAAASQVTDAGSKAVRPVSAGAYVSLRPVSGSASSSRGPRLISPRTLMRDTLSALPPRPASARPSSSPTRCLPSPRSPPLKQLGVVDPVALSDHPVMPLDGTLGGSSSIGRASLMTRPQSACTAAVVEVAEVDERGAVWLHAMYAGNVAIKPIRLGVSNGLMVRNSGGASVATGKARRPSSAR